MSKIEKMTGRTLARPEATQPVRIDWWYATVVVVVHFLALLALVPWLFSWTGLIACVLGLYVFGMVGINLGFHRLLTHRGLSCPRWLERCFALLGTCCLQGTPARWVAIHRMHHQHSDKQDDPHSPQCGFLWSHFGWILVQSREHSVVYRYERYSRDLLRDRFYLWLERRLMLLWIYVAQAAIYYLVGLVIGWAVTGDPLAGVQLGASLLVWGVFVRTVLVWHITWSVNSLSHVCGYQNYDTRDDSRNNWVVALISNGEGWHNNHHWDQRCAAHGHKWWEIDLTYITIRVLETLGLAKNVVRRPRRMKST